MDRRGDIWFGSTLSASRFTPEPEVPHRPTPVYFTSIRSSAREVPLAEWGETAVHRIALRPYENSVEVDFVGIEMGMGRSLEYEYTLEGAQREWQPVGRQRAVHFASLAPGSYRILVRAINNEGTRTDPPASVELFVPLPVWRRWWSLSLIAMALAASLYVAHRRRVRHVLEIERVRTRIATDLHDDVGASLSQVAIMSEVASRGAEPDGTILAEIADTSRALLQAMSEIVWGIDPSHDRLQDLTQRMRWFAGETLSSCGVVLHFSAGEREANLRLSIETRRQLFLIFKECVNNLARHAQARHAYITLRAEQNGLMLEVRDDGRGFVAGQRAGHGLHNMAVRARTLDASLEVDSGSGKGTRITLRVPLKQRLRLWRRIRGHMNLHRPQGSMGHRL
jgi:signal transduction histidine kinase